MLDIEDMKISKFPEIQRQQIELKSELLHKAKSIVNENPIYFHMA